MEIPEGGAAPGGGGVGHILSSIGHQGNMSGGGEGGGEGGWGGGENQLTISGSSGNIIQDLLGKEPPKGGTLLHILSLGFNSAAFGITFGNTPIEAIRSVFGLPTGPSQIFNINIAQGLGIGSSGRGK